MLPCKLGALALLLLALLLSLSLSLVLICLHLGTCWCRATAASEPQGRGCTPGSTTGKAKLGRSLHQLGYRYNVACKLRIDVAYQW